MCYRAFFVQACRNVRYTASAASCRHGHRRHEPHGWWISAGLRTRAKMGYAVHPMTTQSKRVRSHALLIYSRVAPGIRTNAACYYLRCVPNAHWLVAVFVDSPSILTGREIAPIVLHSMLVHYATICPRRFFVSRILMHFFKWLGNNLYMSCLQIFYSNVQPHFPITSWKSLITLSRLR